jgi:hypothetical protein
LALDESYLFPDRGRYIKSGIGGTCGKCHRRKPDPSEAEWILVESHDGAKIIGFYLREVSFSPENRYDCFSKKEVIIWILSKLESTLQEKEKSRD